MAPTPADPATSVGMWLRDWGLDGLFSSLLAGFLGGLVVLGGVKLEQRERRAAARRADLEVVRDGIGQMYLWLATITGQRLPGPERRALTKEVSARLVLLQIAAQRGYPDVEGRISLLQVRVEQGPGVDEGRRWVAPGPLEPAVVDAEEELVKLLSESLHWEVPGLHKRVFTRHLRGLRRRRR